MPDLPPDLQRDAREILKMMGGEVPEEPNYRQALANLLVIILVVLAYFLIFMYAPPLVKAIAFVFLLVGLLTNGPKLLAKIRGKLSGE